MHVCSNTGQGAGAGAGVAANASLVALTDGWTWHCVGCDSDEQLGANVDRFIDNSQGLPVWNNEFEVRGGWLDPASSWK